MFDYAHRDCSTLISSSASHRMSDTLCSKFDSMVISLSNVRRLKFAAFRELEACGGLRANDFFAAKSTNQDSYSTI